MVTVFTPVYNREKEIVKLYESLCRQTVKDFEWIVVDDGSKDNVWNELQKFQAETQEFPIRIYQQNNAGKHTAINTGVKYASGEFFVIVDSDDFMVDNAIETIISEFRNLPSNYAGIGLQRIAPDGNVIGSTFQGEYVDATTCDRPKYHIEGDKAEVFYTAVIKKYPFPVFEGEKFLSEACVWYKMSHDGLLIRWINKPAVVCEYLEGGLTDNSEKLALNNFKGSTYKAKVMLQCNLPKSTRMKTIGNYVYLGRLKKMSFTELASNIDVPLYEAFLCFALCALKKKIK